MQEADRPTPLPAGWREVKDATSGKTYYYHAPTKETQWVRPVEAATQAPIDRNWMMSGKMPASPNSGSLRVHLSHAIGLRSMDSNGYSDPFVKLTLGKETHKSEIVRKSLNPRWDKDYFFRGGFEQLVTLPLQVHAWDNDRLSIRNDPLGSGLIDLRQLDLGSCQAVDCSVQLKDEQATPGEVFFTIQWQPDGMATADGQVHRAGAHDEEHPNTFGMPTPMPEADRPTPLPAGWREVKSATSGKMYYYHAPTKKTQWVRPVDTASAIAAELARVKALPEWERALVGKIYTDPEELWHAHMLAHGTLHLFLSHARDLMSMDSNGFSDPYVKFSLAGKEVKTKVIYKNLNPNWSEVFTFTGVLKDLIAEPLSLRCKDKDTLTSNKLGEASVDLGGLARTRMVELQAQLSTQGTIYLRAFWQADGESSPPATFSTPAPEDRVRLLAAVAANEDESLREATKVWLERLHKQVLPMLDEWVTQMGRVREEREDLSRHAERPSTDKLHALHEAWNGVTD
ncbi:c2 domain containing protein, partial [Chrysochromulina tobinii]